VLPLDKTNLPEQTRISIGTAVILELLTGKLDAYPTTAYLLTHKAGKCLANCGFCPQARDSKCTTELLSRVTWPTFPTQNVIAALVNASKQGRIKRICIQALNYPNVFTHLEALVKEIKRQSAIPLSISCQPINKQNILLLANAGVDRLGIGVDTATKALFDKVKGKTAKGPYTWESQFSLLSEAIEVFGNGNVSTHIIVGLGETEKEAVQMVQKCVDLNILPALFAFTPIRGTALEGNVQPLIASYRRVQLARYLIVSKKARLENMLFGSEGKVIGFGLSKDVLESIIDFGAPFLTSGCPDCNRPFYNEKPSGPIYNYPISPSYEEREKIKKQLKN
jgi:lipoyl synthase